MAVGPADVRAPYTTGSIASRAPRNIVHCHLVLRRSGRALFAVAAIALSVAPLVAGELTCVVAYDADLVTVHVQRVPVPGIVREIGRQSGAEVVGDVRKPGDVSQEFDRVPLVDALARLLGEQNFTLRYGPEGQLRTIKLLGAPLAVAPTTQANVSDPDEAASARQDRHRGVRSPRERLPARQPLATAVGADAGDASNASPGPRGGLSDQEGATQDQSDQQVWPVPDELDRKLRRRFLDFLAQMDDASLTEYFATKDGQRAQALLEDFGTNHASGDSSQKANDILRRIPAPLTQEPQGSP